MPVEAIVFLGGPLLCFLLFTILSWRGRHRRSTIVGAVVTAILGLWLLAVAWTSATVVIDGGGGPTPTPPKVVVTPTS